MNKFWILNHKDWPGVESRLAEWVPGETKFRKVHCAIEPDLHFGIRERLTPLSVVLQDIKPEDFVWTTLGECLVQQGVLNLLDQNGFSGYDVQPAKVQYATRADKPPKFWELIIKGSAGMAMGSKVLWSCPGCEFKRFSRVRDAAEVVDGSLWDGSDFFRVEPISGWMFVTDRVIRALRSSKLRGWKERPLASMKASFDVAIPEHISTVN